MNTLNTLMYELRKRYTNRIKKCTLRIRYTPRCPVHIAHAHVTKEFPSNLFIQGTINSSSGVQGDSRQQQQILLSVVPSLVN